MGKNGPKMAKKWELGSFLLFFRPFWAIFSPFRAEGHFLFFGQFFPIFGFRPHSIPGGLTRKAFRIRRFMSKFLGVSLLSSASKKGRTWEHGPGTPCKLLSSRSFSERLERSEKAFRKRRFISKFLGVSLFCFGGKKERTWEHKARTT